MLRSLFSGISGLRAHQQMMDITANNIANVNTTGYKSSQALFVDALSQLLQAAGAPQNSVGGTNPAQIGLGVRLGGVETNFGQGSAQITNRATDMMINGDGFFVVRHIGEQLFTRSGAFSFDTNGLLVDQRGSAVQGWMANRGVINSNATPGDIQIPVDQAQAPIQTTAATLGGNLPENTTNTNPIVTSITAYDVTGAPITLQVNFARVSSTSWTATVSDGTTTGAPQTINFAADGTTPTPASIAFGGITIDASSITNYAGQSTIALTSQNGSAMGSLQGFTVSPDGTIIGAFSNGLKEPMGQIALSNFNNPPGLERAGDSDFRATVNSGPALIGVAGSGGRGSLQNNALEMSNVDLSQEFTNLVIAQRGFQANSKVITTSDDMLNDLVNMKR
jgi:flagellar hook protein FlgE